MTVPRVKGLLASIALLGIVAGVPWFLYALGGGLPTSAPSVHQIGHFLGQPITDTALVRGVGYFCWAVWLLFVAAVASEAAAWVRARPGPSITRRGFRIPGLQGAAGSLFLTALLLLPQRPSAGTPIHPGTTSAPVPASAILTASTAAERSAGTVRPSAAGPGAAGDGRIPYTVQRYDTPWGIAEQHLGNGLRWREITDVNGNTLATGVDEWVHVNGRLIDEPQARLIYPGQILYLPATATTIPVAHLEQPTPEEEPPAATNGHLPGGSHVAPPGTSAVEPSPTPPDQAQPAPPQASPDHREVSAVRHDEQIEMAGLLAAGMVAGATLTTITRLRLGQARARRPGRRIRIPTGELASKEMALRVASRGDLIGATHRALNALVADLESASLPAPTIHAVLAGDEAIEVLLERPARPPGSWKVTGDGFRWRIEHDAIPQGPAEGHPLPTLLPIGRVPATTTEVMINLDAAGLVGVMGDTEHSTGLVTSAGLALAGLPWANSADVVLVGFGESLSLTGAHLRSVAYLDDALDEIESLPAGAPGESLRRGRLWVNGDRPDGWLPTVILSTAAASARSVQRLKSLCEDRPELSAVIIAPDDNSGWILKVDSDPAYIPELRLALDLTLAREDEIHSFGEIIETALDLNGVTVDDPPYVELESGTRPSATPREPSESPTPARINVLGVVEFVGVSDFRRPRSQETTIYLAMHPDGVSEGQLDEKIWPSRRDVPSSTRDPVISAVRAALGGPDWFPHAQGQGQAKIYRLSNKVGTDWSQFCALYRAGRESRSVEPLRSALELVRGRPFGGLDDGPGYQWLHTEGHVRHMQAEIADCADLAAGMYLDAGQPVDVRWAATRGLLADEYSERLWVRLMAAADALGETAEIDRILAEMDARMGLDGDFESLHPDTVAAYREYSRRGRRQVI